MKPPPESGEGFAKNSGRESLQQEQLSGGNKQDPPEFANRHPASRFGKPDEDIRQKLIREREEIRIDDRHTCRRLSIGLFYGDACPGARREVLQEIFLPGKFRVGF